MTERYEPPEERAVLTNEEIRKRYQDTALVIYKEQQSKRETNYLSFGTSRRTMEYSNYGNQPVIVRRPAASLATSNTADLSSRIARIRKPRDSCVIN